MTTVQLLGALPYWLVRSSSAEDLRKYNPGQLRDPGGEGGGQWVSNPGSAAKAAVSDALKLAGTIDLAPDEQLIGSAKLDGDAGGIRLALTERGGRRMLRLGAGGEDYGKRNREEGVAAWDGNPSPEGPTVAEEERLTAESDALDAEYDDATPARQDEITARQNEIREQLTTGEYFNGTAEIDEYGWRRLADKIRPALAEAVEQSTDENVAYDEIEELKAEAAVTKVDPDPDRMAELQRIVARDQMIVFDQGIVPGSGPVWGDVYWSVELDDSEVGPEFRLGVQPKGVGDDWGDDKDWRGRFDASETRKFLRLLDRFAAASTSDQSDRSYNPGQKRDPNGEWGDGVPGPSTDFFDMSGLTDVIEVEGTFGDLAMGLHDTGDVRLTFRSDGQVRELDLGIDEVRELGHAVERLAGERKNLPEDADSDGVYDEDWFGNGQHNRVSLLGNEVVEVVFGADEDDPWSLMLDPPYETEDEDVDDAQLLLDAIDHIFDASPADARSSAGVRSDAQDGFDNEAEEWEEAITALVTALTELSGEARAAFDPGKHPRGPGGKFRSTVDKLKAAIETHRAGGGKGDPFEGYDREQLRRAAKTRGIALSRGEGRESIAQKLLNDLGGGPKEDSPKLEEPKPVKKAPAKRAPRKKAEPKPERTPKNAVRPRDSGRVAGRDLIAGGDAELARQVTADADSYKSADPQLASIAAKQNFDGPPRVVPRSEMDRLAGDREPLFRGAQSRGGISAAAMHEQTRTGDAWFGNGIFGNGIYFATNEEKTRYYSDGTPNSMLRAVLDPDANVITLDELRKLLSDYDRRMEDDDPRWPVFSDPGRLAAALGYDAVRVPRPQGEGGDQVYVLNRTALIVEEAE
ncbi:MAG: hypothetical protein V4515_13200 [Chloroflexota bacterium]